MSDLDDAKKQEVLNRIKQRKERRKQQLTNSSPSLGNAVGVDDHARITQSMKIIDTSSMRKKVAETEEAPDEEPPAPPMMKAPAPPLKKSLTIATPTLREKKKTTISPSSSGGLRSQGGRSPRSESPRKEEKSSLDISMPEISPRKKDTKRPNFFSPQMSMRSPRGEAAQETSPRSIHREYDSEIVDEKRKRGLTDELTGFMNTLGLAPTTVKKPIKNISEPEKLETVLSSSQKHACPVCSVGFASKELLLTHLNGHNEKTTKKEKKGLKSPRADLEHMTLSPKQLKHNNKRRGQTQSEILVDGELDSVGISSPSPATTPSFATVRIGTKSRGSPKLSQKSDFSDDITSPKPSFSRFNKFKVDSSRAPTVAELERDIDYSTLEELPPLPDQAPITNKNAYKGYMKLKFAWSERRTGQKLNTQTSPNEEPLVMAPVEKDYFRKASHEADDILDDIFDSSRNILMTEENIEVVRNETNEDFTDFTQEVNLENDEEEEEEEYGSDATQELSKIEDTDFYHKPASGRKFTVQQPNTKKPSRLTMELNDLDKGLDELDELLEHEPNFTEENALVDIEEFDNEGGGGNYDDDYDDYEE